MTKEERQTLFLIAEGLKDVRLTGKPLVQVAEAVRQLDALVGPEAVNRPIEVV